MQRHALAAALIALTPIAFAANSSTEGTLDLGQVVAGLESRYPGKVVAIELDASGDKAAHYHVDMQFAERSFAKLDVDAATLEVTGREAIPLKQSSMPFSYAAAVVAGSMPGRVISAQLDATNGSPVHYDVDVQLPQGAIARLKIDAATQQIGWRVPAIIEQ